MLEQENDILTNHNTRYMNLKNITDVNDIDILIEKQHKEFYIMH